MNTSATETHPYAQLGPATILAAVESLGWRCDGHQLALNSYENRVFQVGIEDEPPLIAKFYRPGRWSDEAILEEHDFSLELAEREIPVVAPLRDAQGNTLHHHQGFRFAVFPRHGGRAPDLESADSLQRMGSLLGRMHALGSVRCFNHRPDLNITRFGQEPRQWLLDSPLIPPELHSRYAEVSAMVLEAVTQRFADAGETASLRLHGDCHSGNILWTEAGAHFVDLDDCLNGPAIQDLWMLLSGSRQQMSMQLGEVLEGYMQFHEFDARELHLVEALRSLRMIHFSAWLGRRQDDPAFPPAFPWFGNDKYWEEQILTLLEQRAALDEPALELPL